MKRLTTALLALLALPALTAAVYFQGAQSPGQLGLNGPGVPYIVDTTGAAAIANTTSCRLVHTGGAPNTSATAANTDQTPVITEVYYAEVYVPAPCTATGVAPYNGSAVSGNMKVGLASSTGAILATSATTAASGTTVYQRVPFTAAIAVVPGTYYLLTFYDNTTQRPTAWTAGSFGAGKVTGQTYATGFVAFTPATTFTTALGPVASLY